MSQQLHIAECKNAGYIRVTFKRETNNKRFTLNFNIPLFKMLPINDVL